MAEETPAGGTGHLGHNLIPTLPTSVRWQAVAQLLAGGAAADEVIAATAIAAERQLRAAPSDPVYVEAVRLLFLVPVAAKDADFGDALRQVGLTIGNEPDLTDILFAAGDRLDRVARGHGRGSDFGELARRALISALSSRIGADLPGLFDANPTEIRRAAARFGYRQSAEQGQAGRTRRMGVRGEPGGRLRAVVLGRRLSAAGCSRHHRSPCRLSRAEPDLALCCSTAESSGSRLSPQKSSGQAAECHRYCRGLEAGY